MALNDRPYSVFNFAVEIYPDGRASVHRMGGLEMTMDVQTIREGGANDRAYRVPSVVNYSNLTLKRGMTANRELWKWFVRSHADPFLRADAEVVMFAEDGQTEKMRFRLSRCIPIKMKVPPLNAKDGGIAIEDFALAYEKFELVEAGAGGSAE